MQTQYRNSIEAQLFRHVIPINVGKTKYTESQIKLLNKLIDMTIRNGFLITVDYNEDIGNCMNAVIITIVSPNEIMNRLSSVEMPMQIGRNGKIYTITEHMRVTYTVLHPTQVQNYLNTNKLRLIMLRPDRSFYYVNYTGNL
jgi:hypothetical protein